MDIPLSRYYKPPCPKHTRSGCTSAYVEQTCRGGVTWHSLWLTELFHAVRVCDKAITQHIITSLILERPFSSTISGEHLSPPINQKELFSLSLKPPETHGHPHLCLTKAHKPHLHPKALWLAANPAWLLSVSHFSPLFCFNLGSTASLVFKNGPPEPWMENFESVTLSKELLVRLIFRHERRTAMRASSLRLVETINAKCG